MRAVITSIGLVVSACNQATTESTILTKSQSSENVVLTVSVAPPEQIDTNGLLITAVVKNQGMETFRYTATCGQADLDFRFSDSNGNEVQVRNPCEPDPMMGCPTGLGIVLAPGRPASAGRLWSGMLWDGCNATEAPAGNYRVTVTFTFYQDIEAGRDQVEANGTFHWPP